MDLEYVPDLIILGNASNSRTIHVSFDEKAAEARGIPINPNSVEKFPIRARRISAVPDGGNPILYIMALAYRRVTW